jgi:mycofactocin system glycosyltransferase
MIRAERASAILTGRVSLDPSTRLLAPDLLVGGTPLRLLRLSPVGVRAIEELQAGDGAVSGGAAQLARVLVDAGMAHPEPGSPTSLEELTVVVPVVDRPDQLDALLGDLTGVSVIVVDDASEDADAIARVAASHGATLVRREVPVGPGAARNLGSQLASGELVCFLDSDVRVPSGSIEAILGHFSDPNVGAVAPRVRGPRSFSVAQRFEHDASPLDMGARPGAVRPGARISYVPSAALVVRRVLTDDLFDPTLAIGEDVDAIWRLVDAGWTVRYEPSVEIEHPARPTLLGWLVQRYRYGTSAAELEARHGDAAAPLRGSPWALGGWAMLAAGRPLAGLGLLAAGQPALREALEDVTERPGATAWRLLGERTLSITPIVARQLLRSYAPLLAISSVLSRRCRRATVLVVLVAGLGRWAESDAELDPARFVALSTLDDVTYATGVWSGAISARRLGALRPRTAREPHRPRSPHRSSPGAPSTVD